MDYKEIVENLDVNKVISLMEKLGATRWVDKGNHIIFPTICHNVDENDASDKLYFYKDTKLFVCYTECGNQSIFGFLKNYYETRNMEYNWYEDIYEVILDCSNLKFDFEFAPIKYKSIRDNYVNAIKTKELPIYPEHLMECFIKYYPIEWLNDGITKTAMDKFNIKFSLTQNKIIIPHYNINGELIGIRGRALNEWEVENIGKYMPVQIENVWYSHPLSLNLYGLNLNKDNIKRTGICFVCESEKAVLQLENFDMLNCGVAVCGSQFNKRQVNLLIKTCHPKEIILCFDKEEIGLESKYFNKLYSICKRYKNYANFSFIYDRDGLLNLKDSPTDRGQETFKKLLEKRVIVK